MTTGRELREIAAKMLNIDKQQLEDAGVIKLNTRGGSDWNRFNDEPLMFICKLGDEQLEALASMVSPSIAKDGA